jgi:hypothetical protein
LSAGGGSNSSHAQDRRFRRVLGFVCDLEFEIWCFRKKSDFHFLDYKGWSIRGLPGCLKQEFGYWSNDPDEQ